VVAFSAYSSYIDWRTLTYPPILALAMLWLGLVSTTLRSFLALRSHSPLLLLPPDLSLALTASLFLNRLDVVAEGDVWYFFSLCLCFPRYPYKLAYLISQYLRIVPKVSSNTSLAMVLLTNTCILTPCLLAMSIVVKSDVSHCSKALYLSSIALGIISMNPVLLLLVPLLLISRLHGRASKYARVFPMIPCLFLSLIMSLTFGDLLMVLS